MGRLRGYVTCVDCTLDEARKAHPELSDLYELRHEQGHVVMQISEINNSADRSRNEEISGKAPDIIHSPFIAIRAEERLYKSCVRKKIA